MAGELWFGVLSVSVATTIASANRFSTWFVFAEDLPENDGHENCGEFCCWIANIALLFQAILFCSAWPYQDSPNQNVLDGLLYELGSPKSFFNRTT